MLERGSVAAFLDQKADRLTDRLMRRFPGPRIVVETDRPLVSFTFDDVPDTALSNGARILEGHGVRGTFYIAGGLVGREEPGRRLISEDGCRRLAEADHEIGCHTFSHRKARGMGRRAMAADLSRNAAFLDGLAEGGSRRRNFAYPFNAASFPARKLFAANFRTCRGGGDRINRGAVNPAFLYGMEIRQPEHEAAGLSRHIDEVVRHPGWLIFFTHDIAERPTPFGCTPDTFERLVAHARMRGCTILPVGKALDTLGVGP